MKALKYGKNPYPSPGAFSTATCTICGTLHETDGRESFTLLRDGKTIQHSLPCMMCGEPMVKWKAPAKVVVK